MKRKYLTILIVLLSLCVIIFLGYNIYNYINYVPRAEDININITVNEITEDTLQRSNLIL